MPYQPPTGLSADRAVAPDDDGWVEATFRLESIDGAAVGLLSLGPEVSVLSPESLRDKVAALARATAELYPRPGNSGG